MTVVTRPVSPHPVPPPTSPCPSIPHRGNNCHKLSMAIQVERDSPTWQPMTDGAEDTVIEALHDLARWLYRQHQREYEHQTSDAVVDEVIAVGWTFAKEGTRFG